MIDLYYTVYIRLGESELLLTRKHNRQQWPKGELNIKQILHMNWELC